MGVYVYFKGVPDPIQAIIVYSSKDLTTSFDDLVPKDTRNVLEINFPETVDFDTSMKTLQSELTDLFRQEEESKKELLGVFKDLGYEIKLWKTNWFVRI